jgi:hypothetical protein
MPYRKNHPAAAGWFFHLYNDPESERLDFRLNCRTLAE